MQIIDASLSRKELHTMAESRFRGMVKAVVDIERGLLAVDAELHSDLEALLLEEGSKQEDLWGINLYPDQAGEGFIEHDSLINIRPSQGNPSRGVEDPKVRDRIRQIVLERVAP